MFTYPLMFNNNVYIPMTERFSIEVETVYTNDGGHQENIFNLSKSDRKSIEPGEFFLARIIRRVI